MIHLDTDVTSRARSIKDIHLYVFCLSKSDSCLLGTNTKIGIRHFRESSQTGLEIMFIAF